MFVEHAGDEMTDHMIAKIGREIAKSNTLFSRLRQHMRIRTRTSPGNFLYDLIGVQPGDYQALAVSSTWAI